MILFQSPSKLNSNAPVNNSFGTHRKQVHCISVDHRIYYDIEICLIRKCFYTQVNGEISLLRLFKKKPEAIEKWHSKAMLIDPNKTRITIINT